MRAIGDLASETLMRLGKENSKRTTDPNPAQTEPWPALLARLLEDPLLDPVDKIVWLVIRQHLEVHGPQTPLPSFRQMAQSANIASVSTVSRAVAILRITRWIRPNTDCGAPAGGRGGAGCWLAGTPVSLAEALAREPDYVPFLQRACAHSHAQVRRLAKTLLKAVEAVDPENPDDGAPAQSLAPSPIEEQPMSAQTLGERISFRSAGMGRLQNATGGEPTRHANESANPVEPVRNLDVQKSNVQNLDSPPGSRCCLYKTTTTPTVQNSNKAAETPSLVFPARLSPHQREAAARHLAEVQEAQRQVVLDELEGRLRLERQGAKPVYDPVRYLRHLCGQVKAGNFEPNLGLAVGRERRERQRSAARVRQRRMDQDNARLRPRERRDVGAQLAALKSALGHGSGPAADTLTAENQTSGDP